MKQTLNEYLAANIARGVIDHAARASFDGQGQVTLYIHPANVDGDTPTYRVDGNNLMQLYEASFAPTEHELQLKGLTAPRVTPQRLEEVVVSEYFHVPPGTTLTICVLTLANGFTVVGKSACASPANFDAGIGQRYARDNAKNQIWELEGYALRNQLAEAAAG